MKKYNSPSNKSIHDLIMEEFDVDLPIGKVTGLSIKDPIVMLKNENYVHNEYDVIEYLAFYRFVEWKFISQALISIRGRKYDLIKILVTDLVNSNCWTEVFYFEVSDCFEYNTNHLVEME